MKKRWLLCRMPLWKKKNNLPIQSPWVDASAAIDAAILSFSHLMVYILHKNRMECDMRAFGVPIKFPLLHFYCTFTKNRSKGHPLGNFVISLSHSHTRARSVLAYTHKHILNNPWIIENDEMDYRLHSYDTCIHNVGSKHSAPTKQWPEPFGLQITSV